jgi:hypothetical protein
VNINGLGDIDGVEKYLEAFREHSVHIQEVCRLLHHISLTDALHVRTGQTERNLRALAPMVSYFNMALIIHGFLNLGTIGWTSCLHPSIV